jgi:hypothetical protein
MKNIIIFLLFTGFYASICAQECTRDSVSYWAKMDFDFVSYKKNDIPFLLKKQLKKNYQIKLRLCNPYESTSRNPKDELAFILSEGERFYVIAYSINRGWYSNTQVLLIRMENQIVTGVCRVILLTNRMNVYEFCDLVDKNLFFIEGQLDFIDSIQSDQNEPD